MTIAQKRDFIICIAFIVTVVGVAFVGIKYIIPWLFPFVAGFLIAFLLKPACMYLTKITHIKRRGAALSVIALFYLVVGLVLWLVGLMVAGQMSSLLGAVPRLYEQEIMPFLSQLNEDILAFFNRLSPTTANYVYQLIDSVMASLQEMMSSLSASLVGGVTHVAKKVPFYLITILFSIISSILISVEYTTVSRFILRQFSPRLRHTLLECKNFLIGTVFKMLRAYIIIFAITFAELAVGLFFLKVEYFLPLAALIAVLDIMPLIGTGGILIPWVVFQLLAGNYFMGVGLLIVYAIITLVRNILEPKIVGDQIGLHPIVTITAMYVGLRLFGFLGLIAAPMVALTIKYLNEGGKIALYK